MSETTKYPKAPRLRVTVDEATIEDSKRRDSGHCMIAQAVRSMYPQATRVAVDVQTIRFTDPKKNLRYIYLTPRVAQVALVQFDQEITPEPFAFQLRNGQVTLARSTKNDPTKTKKTLTEAQKAALKKASEANSKQAKKLRNAKLVDERGTGAVPRRVGGTPPPLVPGGRRREFGLRGLAK